MIETASAFRGMALPGVNGPDEVVVVVWTRQCLVQTRYEVVGPKEGMTLPRRVMTMPRDGWPTMPWWVGQRPPVQVLPLILVLAEATSQSSGQCCTAGMRKWFPLKKNSPCCSFAGLLLDKISRLESQYALSARWLLMPSYVSIELAHQLGQYVD